MWQQKLNKTFYDFASTINTKDSGEFSLWETECYIGAMFNMMGPLLLLFLAKSSQMVLVKMKNKKGEVGGEREGGILYFNSSSKSCSYLISSILKQNRSHILFIKQEVKNPYLWE